MGCGSSPLNSQSALTFMPSSLKASARWLAPISVKQVRRLTDSQVFNVSMGIPACSLSWFSVTPAKPRICFKRLLQAKLCSCSSIFLTRVVCHWNILYTFCVYARVKKEVSP